MATTLPSVLPTTGARLVSLDILKSSGILMVLLLHTTQEAVDQGKYFGGLEALPRREQDTFAGRFRISFFVCHRGR